MGAIRVTQGLLTDRILSNLSRQLRSLAVLQEHLSTGLRVNRPSDDPIDARRAVSIRNQIGANEQFLDNVSDVQPQLTATSTILQRLTDAILRAQELTIAGGNDTNSQNQLDAIALEINQLLEAVFDAGNQKTNGRYIFAGTRTLTPAFSATRVGGEITTVSYDGNANAIEVALSEGSRATINIAGSVAFQSTVDIFQVLIDIRDDLRAGNRNDLRTLRLGELSQALDQTLQSQATVGAIQNRTERVAADTEDFLLQLQASLSDEIDADFAQTIVNFNAQTNAFQAALNAAARVIQPSLLDFIR